ncbi:MAG: M28 family peptidase [Bacteroidota bacterium]
MLEDTYSTLQKHHRRLKRDEKDAFLDAATLLLENWGYKVKRVATSSRLRSSVHLETEVKEAECIIMAHYDTPTMLPPWIELLVRALGHTRPLLLTVAVGLVVFIPSRLPGELFGWVTLIVGLSLLIFLIPNPKNLNDNTSGILGLLDLAQQLEAFPAAKKKVKFVLVDNEEWMLIGATQLRKKWLEEGFEFDESRIICLDCIGWGDVPVIIRNGASHVGNELIDVFQEEKPESQLINMKAMPLNDNFVFRDEGAILVSMMKKAWWKGGYYIPNIHSIFDKKLDLNAIKWVTHNLLAYLKEEQVVRKRRA